MFDLIAMFLRIPLLLLGAVCGGVAERRHLRSLQLREKELTSILLTDIKSFPGGTDPGKGAMLVMGEAVIASDYFKLFLAKLRNLIGGQVKSYQTLLDRGRREALLRMSLKAHAQGYDAVCNVRLNTATIGSNMIEVTVSGTAYLRPERPAAT